MPGGTDNDRRNRFNEIPPSKHNQYAEHFNVPNTESLQDTRGKTFIS